MEEKLDKETLKQDFIKTRVLWGEYTSTYRYKKANTIHDKCAKIMNDIWRLPDKGEGLLSSLLDHENEFVRLGASCHLLSLNEESAKVVLKQLIKTTKSYDIEFNAENILIEWDEGRLENVRNRKNEL